MRRLALALAMVMLLAVGGTALAATAWRTATSSDAAADHLRSLIVAEHKRYCTDWGSYLAADSRLDTVANWKATDMGLRGYFAHATRDGRYVWEFYDRVGIPYPHGAGEIIAWNSYPDDLSAAAAFKQFMSSTRHRRAIHRCSYDYLGVGTFKAKSKRLFVVEFTNTV